MQVQEWLIERERLLGRIKELEAENAELRKRLGEDVTPIEKKPTAMLNLSLQEKVDLFRSLFKGREDVFARRWYSKTSRKGERLHGIDAYLGRDEHLCRLRPVRLRQDDASSHVCDGDAQGRREPETWHPHQQLQGRRYSFLERQPRLVQG